MIYHLIPGLIFEKLFDSPLAGLESQSLLTTKNLSREREVTALVRSTKEFSFEQDNLKIISVKGSCDKFHAGVLSHLEKNLKKEDFMHYYYSASKDPDEFLEKIPNKKNLVVELCSSVDFGTGIEKHIQKLYQNGAKFVVKNQYLYDCCVKDFGIPKDS
jgi:hypothetical protein